MRGKAATGCAPRTAGRITPACAGKSIMAHSTRTCTWDHPRVCGEKGHTQLFANIRIGSPPRVRGKVGSSSMCTRSPGITPACAGKREKRVEKIPQIWDHPRVCGEKMPWPLRTLVIWGSPPRVRGKGRLCKVPQSCTGITPACAGKRLKRSHSIGHFSCILCLFHSVLHRASVSGGSRAGPCAPPCLPAQNAVPV